jgi:hypothetical protein
MSFMEKVGVVFKFWDAKRAPAVTALFFLILVLIGAGIGYGIYSLFGG